jgi:hypothetical protein
MTEEDEEENAVDEEDEDDEFNFGSIISPPALDRSNTIIAQTNSAASVSHVRMSNQVHPSSAGSDMMPNSGINGNSGNSKNHTTLFGHSPSSLPQSYTNSSKSLLSNRSTPVAGGDESGKSGRRKKNDESGFAAGFDGPEDENEEDYEGHGYMNNAESVKSGKGQSGLRSSDEGFVGTGNFGKSKNSSAGGVRAMGDKNDALNRTKSGDGGGKSGDDGEGRKHSAGGTLKRSKTSGVDTELPMSRLQRTGTSSGQGVGDSELSASRLQRDKTKSGLDGAGKNNNAGEETGKNNEKSSEEKGKNGKQEEINKGKSGKDEKEKSQGLIAKFLKRSNKNTNSEVEKNEEKRTGLAAAAAVVSTTNTNNNNNNNTANTNAQNIGDGEPNRSVTATSGFGKTRSIGSPTSVAVGAENSAYEEHAGDQDNTGRLSRSAPRLGKGQKIAHQHKSGGRSSAAAAGGDEAKEELINGDRNRLDPDVESISLNDARSEEKKKSKLEKWVDQKVNGCCCLNTRRRLACCFSLIGWLCCFILLIILIVVILIVLLYVYCIKLFF